MTISTTRFARGGYAFIKGTVPYSAGVAALPGFRIERVRFATSMPLAEGFERIEAIIRSAGRPLTALCSCELRSPAPFTEAGFRQFNEVYVAILEKWGLIEGGDNPVARSNVCPAIDPPHEPSFYAFSFTTEAKDAPPSFVTLSPAATSRQPRCGRRRCGCSARWSDACRRSERCGGTRPRSSSTPSTTSIPSWRRRSCAEALLGTGSLGISTGRRSSTSSSRWIAGRFKSSVSSDPRAGQGSRQGRARAGYLPVRMFQARRTPHHLVGVRGFEPPAPSSRS